MNWIFSAILCAVFLSAAAILEKRGLHKVHATDFAVTVSFFSVFWSLPFFFFVDWQSVTLSKLGLIFSTALFASIAFFLVAKAIRHMDISEATPLLALSPGATSLLAFAILGEHLATEQIAGICLMIFGSFLLAIRPEQKIGESINTFRRSRYVQFIFLSLLFYSMGAIFDRAILTDFSVPVFTYMAFFHIFMAILYIPMVFAFGGGVRGVGEAMRVASAEIMLTSLFTVCYRFFQLEALSVAYVGLVSAIKRSSSFFTLLIGGGLFHEKHLVRKVVASSVIILGVLAVVL